jgi:hypothetical protein
MTKREKRGRRKMSVSLLFMNNEPIILNDETGRQKMKLKKRQI